MTPFGGWLHALWLTTEVLKEVNPILVAGLYKPLTIQISKGIRKKYI